MIPDVDHRRVDHAAGVYRQHPGLLRSVLLLRQELLDLDLLAGLFGVGTHQPLVGLIPGVALYGTVNNIMHHIVDIFCDLNDPVVIHFWQKLVFPQDLLLCSVLLRKDGTDLVYQTLRLFLVLVPQTHLPEHHGTKVDIPHHDGDRYVHDAAVAQVDVGAAPAHCLNSCQRIAAEATLARNGILSHDAAERGTATVFRDRLPLDVDADDGGTGQLRQPVLHFFPERDIQNVFYGVFKPAHTFDFPSPCRTFEHCHHK